MVLQIVGRTTDEDGCTSTRMCDAEDDNDIMPRSKKTFFLPKALLEFHPRLSVGAFFSRSYTHCDRLSRSNNNNKISSLSYTQRSISSGLLPNVKIIVNM